MGTFWIGGMKITGKLKSNRRNRLVVVLRTDGAENGEVKIKKPPSDKMIENMRRMKGCGVVVKALRLGFQDLLKLYTDAYFTARLIKLVSTIYMLKPGNEGSKRFFNFSAHKALLATMRFSVKTTRVEALQYHFNPSHSLDRKEATLLFNGFEVKWQAIPSQATHYRLFHHLCVISDYVYSEASGRFEPLGVKDSLCVIVYSRYLDMYVQFMEEIVVGLPSDVVLSEADSVIESVGIEFYYKSGRENYSHCYGGSGVKIVDVF